MAIGPAWMRGLCGAQEAEPRGKYERLVRDPDASAKMTSDESYEPSSAAQLKDGFAFQRALARDVAR